MTGERFECKPLKNVQAGRAIITGRASFHRKKHPGQLCGTNVHLLFLPAYSPDFNPIEKDRANMKRALRDTFPFYDLLQTAVYNYWT
ncbi:MAG: transposase [Spirochaetaceae bacterium]|nr:transposase [Spirochaetaceae bacterium]